MLGFFARPIVKFIAIILLIIFLFSALVRCEPDAWTDVKQIYSQGYIAENGELVSGDLTAVFTKKIIPCTGFRISRDITLDAFFVVHYYNKNGEVFLNEKITSLNYSIEKGFMPTDENGDAAVGIRVSVHLKDKTTGFSTWDRLTMSSKLKISKTSVSVDSVVTSPVDPTDDPVELCVLRLEGF